MCAGIVRLTLVFTVAFGAAACPVGCGDRSPDSSRQTIQAQLAGKKILMVIAPRQFRDEELFTPREFFLARGAKVTVASSATGQVRGVLGRTFLPDAKLAEVRSADYDAVIFVGGPGAKAYFDDAVAHKLAREAAGGGKVIGAICIAPAILAKAGVLKGRAATAFTSARPMLVAGGARLMDTSCVRDGHFVTADGPAAADEFAAAVAKALTD